MGTRKKLQRIIQHGQVIYEPGKCIKCGLCIQIAQREGEELGLSCVGRGFDVRVEVPFNESLENGLKKAARACIEACPTAALAWLGPIYSPSDHVSENSSVLTTNRGRRTEDGRRETGVPVSRPRSPVVHGAKTQNII